MFTLEDILEGTGGRLDAEPLHDRFSTIVIDSRQATRGALFFALNGERVDGHDYVGNAIGNGAIGAVVREDWPTPDWWPPESPLIRVDDPLSALQRLAAWWRARHDGVQVVGITGSIGKTTTKEVVAGVLSRRFNTLKSEGNLNNEIGLPLTLLQLTERHEKAVLEMGAGYALGELTMLCEWARPAIAVVTSVHPVHLERMGTIERIALNKSELPRALPPMGTAVLNGDDPLVRQMAEVTRANVLFYGRQPPLERSEGTDDRQQSELDIWASEVESRGLEGVRFRLHFGETGESWPVNLPLLGAHSVYSALAAAGVGYAAGMEWAEIVAALDMLDVHGRVQLVSGYNGSTLIDDSYNAAPASVIAALDLLREMPGRQVAVLGDMFELGSHEEEGHREVGRHAAQVAHHLVAVGRLGRIIGEEAIRAGMPSANVAFVDDNVQAIAYLKSMLQPGDHVLVKGSRGMYMEEIVERLEVTKLEG
jgi:UDP-N-acetylmuramoyl-tripeptide--D-alanyl-D-alanine ligase